MKRLNVGCGENIRKDWINLDIHKLKGVDVVQNIEEIPWPFPSDYFEEVECNHVLEHVEYVPILEEIYRILKKNGILRIKVPHFSSHNNYIDPTHRKLFSVRTFEFFIKDSDFKKNYYFNFAYENIISSKITFAKKWKYFFNYILDFVININPQMRTFYEASFLRNIFPADNIIIELKK